VTSGESARWISAGHLAFATQEKPPCRRLNELLFEADA